MSVGTEMAHRPVVAMHVILLERRCGVTVGDKFCCEVYVENAESGVNAE
jgi:hypothetical protein